jgi:murein DD-endopeptidase MepM/ murein hydrolase activator NlpD
VGIGAKLGFAVRRLRKKHVSLVISRGTTRTVSFKFSLFRLYLAAGFFLIIASVLGFLSLEYADKATDETRLKRLIVETERQEEYISQLNNRRKSLQNDVLSQSRFDDNIRLVHDLDTIDKSVREAGVGGPLGNVAHLMKIGRDEKIDRLELAIRQAELQKQSFEEILKTAEREKHILDHTPSIKPTIGPVVSGFGWRRNPLFGGVQFHKGLDIATPTGSPIVAPADGVVKSSGMKGGYGYCVFIDHGYGFETRYAHCSAILVSEGESVKRGDLIALVGTTGWSIGPHLHYEVLVNHIHVDPARYVLPDYMVD